MDRRERDSDTEETVEVETVRETPPPAMPPPGGADVEEAVVEQYETVRPGPDGSMERDVVRHERRRRMSGDRIALLLLLLALLVAGGIGAWWYFTQEDTRDVPAVQGLAEAEAVARVEEEGLDADVTRAPSEAPEGTVFDQDPAPGTDVEEGSSVRISVSGGPAEKPVPNAVGLTEAAARDRLVAAGFEVTTREVFSEDEPGTVVAQSPAAGADAGDGATVTINVSKGTADVDVPNVVGLSRAEAEAEIESAKLEPNVVVVPSNEPEGTVVAQNPARRHTAGRLDGPAQRVRGPVDDDLRADNDRDDPVGLEADEASQPRHLGPGQVAPVAGPQPAGPEARIPRAAQPDDGVADGLEHPSHLTVPAFVEHELERRRPEAADRRGSGRAVVQLDALRQPCNDVVARLSDDLGDVGLLDAVPRMGESMSERPVVGEEQHTRRVAVEPADRNDADVASDEVDDGRPPLRVTGRRDRAPRLVEKHVPERLSPDLATVDDDDVGTRDERVELTGPPVDRHPARLDQLVGAASRGDPGAGEIRVEAHAAYFRRCATLPPPCTTTPSRPGASQTSRSATAPTSSRARSSASRRSPARRR